jgi:hypothetical protein
MGNCWRVFFVNLLKNEGWRGEMGNCWSCSKRCVFAFEKSLLLVPQLSRKSAFGPSTSKSDKQAPQLLKPRRFSPSAVLSGGFTTVTKG